MSGKYSYVEKVAVAPRNSTRSPAERAKVKPSKRDFLAAQLPSCSLRLPVRHCFPRSWHHKPFFLLSFSLSLFLFFLSSSTYTPLQTSKSTNPFSSSSTVNNSDLVVFWDFLESSCLSYIALRGFRLCAWPGLAQLKVFIGEKKEAKAFEAQIYLLRSGSIEFFRFEVEEEEEEREEGRILHQGRKWGYFHILWWLWLLMRLWRVLGLARRVSWIFFLLISTLRL